MVILYASVPIKVRFLFSLYNKLKQNWLAFNDTVTPEIDYNVSNVVLETVTHQMWIPKNNLVLCFCGFTQSSPAELLD